MADSQTNIVISAVDKTQEAFNSISANLGKLQGGLGALGASLSVGAFVAWQKSLIDAADQMNDLSAKVGIGIEQLAGYKLAAEQSGTSMEAVAKGVKNLSTYMVEHADKLKAAGITARDADGAMRQLADLFASMPDGVQKTALATQLFGKAGMDMIPMLNLGAKGLDEAAEKSSKYAKQLAELAPKADKFNDSMEVLKINAQGFGMSIATPIVDGLNKIIDALDKEFGGKEGSIGYWLRTQGGSNIKTGQQILDARGGLKPFDPLAEVSVTAKKWVTPEMAIEALMGKGGGKVKAGVDELTRATDAWLKSVSNGAEALDKQIAAAQKEADTVGMSKEAIDAYTAAQTEKAIVEKQAEADALRYAAAYAGPLHDAYIQAANDLDTQIEKMQVLAGLQNDKSIAEMIDRVAQETADAQGKVLDESDRKWKDWERERERSADQLGQALANSLMSGGKNAGEYLKRYFASLVLSPLIQGVMSPVTNAINGVLYGSGPGGGLLGGALGGGSALGSAFNIAGAAGGAWSAAEGGGLYGALATSSIGSALGLSTTTPLMTLGADGALTAGGASITSLSALGTALPWIGGALAIGSALGLFGGGGNDPHNNPDSRYIVGRLGKSGLSAAGGNLAHITMGQTSGSGRWADYSALGADEISQIEKMGSAVFSAGAKLADILGVDAKVLDDVSVEGERFKDAADMASKLGDAIAVKLIPNLADFQQASESLGQTAQRVVGDIQALSVLSSHLGGAGLSGSAADRASFAEAIAAGAGGNLQSTVGSFYANFFSDAERQADLVKNLGEQFHALGLELPTTADEYKNLVLTTLAAGSASADTAGQLLAMNSQVKAMLDFGAQATAATLSAAADSSHFVVSSDPAMAFAPSVNPFNQDKWRIDQARAMDPLGGPVARRNLVLDELRGLREDMDKERKAAHRERLAGIHHQQKTARVLDNVSRGGNKIHTV